MKTYAKLTDEVLVTTCAAEEDAELVAQITADGFKPYDDSAPQPEVGPLQAARPAYREESGKLYLSWEIIEHDPEKIKAEIARLQNELATTDYQIIKSYEYALAGETTPYNIEALHAGRQGLRENIKRLETIKLTSNIFSNH